MTVCESETEDMDTDPPLVPSCSSATAADRPARQQLSQETQTDLLERVVTGSERVATGGEGESSGSNTCSGNDSKWEMLPREMLGR